VHVEFTLCQDEAAAESLIEGDAWPYHAGDGRVAWTDPGIRSFWVTVDGDRFCIGTRL
jgi:hypothetical protein